MSSLHTKSIADLIMRQERKPDGGVRTLSLEESEHTEGLAQCARQLISAVHNKDEKGVRMALEHSFEIMESRPHKEAEEENEEPKEEEEEGTEE